VVKITDDADDILMEWLKIAESVFDDWNNEEDSVYDNI